MPKTNHKKETRPDKAKWKMNSGVLWIGAGVAIIVIIVIVGLVATRGEAGAQVGDHWHAPITIGVCGENWVPTGSPIQSSAGKDFGMHSHGDGLIHIEPSTASTAGKNATLRRFFDSLGSLPSGLKLTETSIQLPGGKLYTNGDACPDGKSGTLRVTVDGTDISGKFLGYKPKDGQRFAIAFS